MPHSRRDPHRERPGGCLAGFAAGRRCGVAEGAIPVVCCGRDRVALVKQTRIKRRKGGLMAKNAVVSQELAEKFKRKK